jgi:chemotaxis protein CheY-P-specific phosphatase CheC
MEPGGDDRLFQEHERHSSRSAADALGRLAGCRLLVEDVAASPVTLDTLEAFTRSMELAVGVFFLLEGDLAGSMLAYFRREDALSLIGALLDSHPASLDALSELECSALAEAGNIVVSAFLVAHEALCGLSVLPSPPSIAIDLSGALLTSAILPALAEGEEVLLFLANLRPVESIEAIACQLLFLPTRDSWQRIRAGAALSAGTA